MNGCPGNTISVRRLPGSTRIAAAGSETARGTGARTEEQEEIVRRNLSVRSLVISFNFIAFFGFTMPDLVCHFNFNVRPDWPAPRPRPPNRRRAEHCREPHVFIAGDVVGGRYHATESCAGYDAQSMCVAHAKKAGHRSKCGKCCKGSNWMRTRKVFLVRLNPSARIHSREDCGAGDKSPSTLDVALRNGRQLCRHCFFLQ